MPNHKSAEKRVRQTERRRLRNRNHLTNLRSTMKKVRDSENSETGSALLSETKTMLDKMVGKGLIHKNKAANYKSSLEKHVNSLS